MCSQMSYNILLLNIVTLSGNPLINFFIQAIAELPSYIIGRFLSDKLGRRFTGIICYLIGTVGFMSMVFSLHGMVH